MNKKKLVMIGNGMAGVRTIEEIIKIAPEQFEITIFGKEPYPNYNRIKLSNILQGDTNFEEIIINSLEWYEENHIQLYIGETVKKIDVEAKQVITIVVMLQSMMNSLSQRVQNRLFYLFQVRINMELQVFVILKIVK